MSDPSFTTQGDEPVEARIVSWVLGEASSFEVAELERLCEAQPELAIFKRRMQALHGMLGEAERPGDSETWKLPAGKRSAIEQLLKGDADAARDHRVNRTGRRAIWAIAACVLLTLVIAPMLVPIALQKKKASPQLMALLDDERAGMVPFSEVAGMDNVPAELIEGTPKPIQVPGLVDPSHEMRALLDGKKGQGWSRNRRNEHKDAVAKTAKTDAPGAPQAPSRSVAKVIASRASSQAGVPAPDLDAFAAEQTRSDLAWDSAAPALGGVGGDRTSRDAAGDELMKRAEMMAEQESGQPAKLKQLAELTDRRIARNGAARARLQEMDREVREPEPRMAQRHSELSSMARSKRTINKEEHSSLGRDEADRSSKTLVTDDIVADGKSRWKRPLPVENEIAAAQEPYSTFSLNINDASFRIAQAALAKGEVPDPQRIQIEQFYNAVDYGDPAPVSGEPVTAAIEQAAHPVIPGRQLVRIAVKTAAAGRGEGQPLRLTLLADQSGSMARDDRRQAMEEALAGLEALLTPQDLVNVIGFARTPRLVAEGVPGQAAGRLADLVNQDASEGGTNLEEAIKLAEQLARRHQQPLAQNRVVLFTDGAANLGDADPQSLAKMVTALRQQGIAFDIAGIVADGLNDELLGELARNGNGRYYVVGKGETEDFSKQLAGAFRPAAENVKVQVRFNPERVGRYKLIGFEKDRLNKEDFRNDAVDAAEMAAEEAGVAIYQVEPLPEGEGEIGEVSVRFRDVASGEMVERTWTIPYDPSAPPVERASPSMQLATLTTLLGEKLKGGPLADAIDFNQLNTVQAGVKEFYASSRRVAEALQMVDQLK